MSVINTNITSMIGQSNLNKSQNALQTSMERLSSGLRINSAKDDAAGQAIANRMTAQITGLNQASRNANDGISIAQTAEGSLNQINDNVQRIRELTVQAANGTNSQEDLNSIQDEINQRLNEIDRISEETDFNGTKVLDDGVGPMTIQVGANDGETISIALTAINRDTLGLDNFNVNGDRLVEAAEEGESYNIGGSSFEVLSAAPTGVTGSTDLLASALSGLTGGQITNLTVGGDIVFDSNGAAFLQTSGGYFAVTDIAISAGASSAAGTITSITVSDEPVTGLTNDAAAVGENKTALPMEQLDDALQTIDSLRSELGAVQNRFEDAITNLDTNSTNLSAARSRIEDADYAVEVANMTRAQILQQAGTSVLAQANQIPQNVLSLLG